MKEQGADSSSGTSYDLGTENGVYLWIGALMKAGSVFVVSMFVGTFERGIENGGGRDRGGWCCLLMGSWGNVSLRNGGVVGWKVRAMIRTVTGGYT